MTTDAIPATPFHVRAGGRLFRITPLETFPVGDDWFSPVDCRDVRTTLEAQAIVEADVAAARETLIASDGIRDALRSAYLNATSYEVGPDHRVGGTHLPDDFLVTLA
jgi:hypothetical protein